MQVSNIRSMPLGPLSRIVLVFLGLLFVSAAVRWPYFGDPAPDFDEQLYYVTGSKLLEGEWPYIDIWDRKPFLLFALYALATALAGGHVLGYQVLAAMFAAVGALQIFSISSRFSTRFAAGWAACLYLVGFPLFLAPVGQSEVFFLPVVIGMLQLVIAIWDETDLGRATRLAMWTMLLGGIALQIKYTALPHCAFAAVVVLWRLWRIDPAPASLLLMTAQFAALGLLPTAAIGLLYLWLGGFHDFWYANFASIFDRGSLSGQILESHRSIIIFRCLVPVALAAAGILRMTMSGWRWDYGLAAGFTAASLVTFFMVGNIYVHYFVPVVAGIAILATPFVAASIPNRIIGLAVLAWAAHQADFGVQMTRSRQDVRALGQLVATAQPHVDNRNCLYVYDGPTVLYQLMETCLPTRYVYPDHLNNQMEAQAVGTDTGEEVARILAGQPGAIITAQNPVVPQANDTTAGLVNAELTRNYLVARRAFIRPRWITVHVRKGSNVERADGEGN